MQAPVLAVEVEQRIPAQVGGEFKYPADHDGVVAEREFMKPGRRADNRRIKPLLQPDCNLAGCGWAATRRPGGRGPTATHADLTVRSNVGIYFGEVPDMIQSSFAIGMNTPNSMLSPPLWDRRPRREAFSDADTN